MEHLARAYGRVQRLPIQFVIERAETLGFKW